MCGIAGFYGPGNRVDIHTMTRALAHRGPDGEGFHHDADRAVHLGHRRLAIVDLEHGSQPMWNQEHSVAVVFNGEIYNHLELRQELEADGFVFQTDHSDTEVLIHGWQRWGRDLSSRLNGMFAFAIWDQTQERFHLARDRFGEKPLYWSWHRGLFLFASELTALAAHSQFHADIDQCSLAKLFAYGFIPAPASLYRYCHKLSAGYWLEFMPADGRVESAAYWSYRIEPSERPPSEEEAGEELEHLLRQSVKRRLMSDVPLGMFLSGGIDSSTVAALAAQHTPVDSFAIGFSEKSYDESKYAQLMANHIGTRHHEEILKMDRARQLVPSVLSRLDEPISDPSILPTFLLSSFTRQHVKVALSGDGGDELFAGYDTFAAIGPARFYHATVPTMLHRRLHRLVDLLPKSSRNMSLDFKLRRALAGVGYPMSQWNPRWLAPLQAEQVSELLQLRMDPEELYAEAIEHWNGSKSSDPMDRTMEFYTRFYLQDDILAKVDRASMLNSLEVRAVFLDVDLAEFARKLPSDQKYRRGARKRVLKRAAANLLPKDILQRPKKGFGIPISDWLKSMPPVQPTRSAPGADFNAVRAWDLEHRSGRKDHRLFLWTWHVLQWHQIGGVEMTIDSDRPSRQQVG